MPPAQRDRIDGVLVLDKPIGPSSSQALGRARWLVGAAKAGHGGTLDPLASGLLPVLFGEATKFAHDLLDADKTYEARVRLGIATTTADAEGEATFTADAPDGAGTEDVIRAACESFRGPIVQVPPAYSALKKDGRPLYEYARAGIDVDVPAREVTVHALDVLAIEPCRTDAWPLAAGAAPEGTVFRTRDVVLRVSCSKGTYIRTLAADIGARLGCGAHLAALRRTRVGALRIEHGLTLDQIDALGDRAARRARLAPVDALLGSLARVDLAPAEAARFRHGQTVPWPTGEGPSAPHPRPADDRPVDGPRDDSIAVMNAGQDAAVPERIRVYGDGHLLGVATPQGRWLKPLRLMAAP